MDELFDTVLDKESIEDSDPERSDEKDRDTEVDFSGESLAVETGEGDSE